MNAQKSKPTALMHVTFSNKSCVEGFITTSGADADWTATGRQKMNSVPTFGADIRDRLDNDKTKLPRKYALVFDTHEAAYSALRAREAADDLLAALSFIAGYAEMDPRSSFDQIIADRARAAIAKARGAA